MVHTALILKLGPYLTDVTKAFKQQFIFEEQVFIVVFLHHPVFVCDFTKFTCLRSDPLGFTDNSSSLLTGHLLLFRREQQF